MLKRFVVEDQSRERYESVEWETVCEPQLNGDTLVYVRGPYRTQEKFMRIISKQSFFQWLFARNNEVFQAISDAEDFIERVK